MVWSLNGFRVDVFEAYMAENSTELREFRFPEIKLTMTLNKGALSRRYCCCRSDLCLSHYLVALAIMLLGLELKLEKVDPIFKFQSISIIYELYEAPTNLATIANDLTKSIASINQSINQSVNQSINQSINFLKIIAC